MTKGTAILEQRLLPLADKPAGMLLIHEIYRSVQGESTFAGFPCVFVRTAVCDARCVWCDTPHAFNQGSPWCLDAIVERLKAAHAAPTRASSGAWQMA